MSFKPTFERTTLRKEDKGSMVTYRILTDRIIQALEQDVVPWEPPYISSGNVFPKNPVTKTEYSGVNLISLWMTGFLNPYWLSYKNASSIKGTKNGKPFTGHVNKDEKGSIICYAERKQLKTTTKKIIGGQEKEVPDSYFLLKYYTVYNVLQCTLPDEYENLINLGKIDKMLTDDQRIIAGEKAIESYCNREGINRTHNPTGAYWQGETNTLNTPTFDMYKLPQRYYHSNFHEMAHSTGEKSRLNRQELEDYHKSRKTRAQEELIADITACFYDAYLGTIDTTFKYSKDYIQNWIQYLNDHPKAIVQASSKAQKAFEYIKGT